jgi:Bacterial membrane protein YfhO
LAVAKSHLRASSCRDLLARARSPSPDAVALLAIAGTVLLANFLYLSGLFDPNPLGRMSGIGIFSGLFDPNPLATWRDVSTPGVLVGLPTIDPSNGQASQALGHLAALDWVHLRLPWWNPYEGTGAPLAGEMQSAALFPFTILLLIGNGQLYEHLLLELVAGISTYYLLRRLSVGRWASAAGAVAFALNGTFAWYTHAPVNVIPFLPLLLLGIEIAFARSSAARPGGWWLIAAAVALSIYAGFPETTYMDGLLAVLWFGWRCGCAGRQRLRAFATKAAVGTIVGGLLATPLLVAFVDYTARAELGAHASSAYANVHLPHAALPQLVLPYVYGPIWGFGPPNVELGTIWGQVGGYLSASLLFFGLLGLISPGRRGLRFVLLAWIVLVVARMYGEPPVLGHVLGVLPGMSRVVFFRYAAPALELPVVVLAALGLDGLLANRIARRRVLCVTAGAVVVLGAATIGAVPLVHRIGEPSPYSRGSVLWAAAVIAAGTLAAILPSSRARRLLAAGAVCLDALVMFVLPELSAPRRIAIDTAPAAFLQRHLGLSRYFTLGPLGPNYGSYYAIRQLNMTDNPFSSVFYRYVVTRLDPAADPFFFTGTPVTSGPTPQQELESHLDGYRAASVRYVVTPPRVRLPQGPSTFTLVFQSRTTWIYRLAGTAPYFTATNPRCVTDPHGGASIRLSCSGPTTLIRRETYMPGWSAEVDGHSTPVREYDSAFQAVTLKPGMHLVTFGYTPPYLGGALAAFLFGCGWLILAPLWTRARGSASSTVSGSSARADEARSR